MKLLYISLLLLAGLLAGGCGKAGSAPSDATNSAAAPVGYNLPTQAQPKLQTLKLWLGPEEMIAELALTLDQVTTGMMFRTNMAENESMLFVFNQPHQPGFWMKNCVLPLSAAYIDPDGVILEIHPLEPGNTNPVVAFTNRIQYVLETRQGWFQRHNVREGMVIRTERGSFQQTFFGKQ